MASVLNSNGIVVSDDGKKRCWWCGADPMYMEYHDTEWGRPVTNDQRLFEKICLEGFQAGLSWLTILRKRQAFRKAFLEFDPVKVAKFSESKVEKLVQNADIIRHRGKIRSTINNANQALRLADEFGSLSEYFWQFKPATIRPITNKSDIAAITDESTRMSNDLKKRGWTFVGPTTCYAFMQAMGLVNDHLVTCDFHG